MKNNRQHQAGRHSSGVIVFAKAPTAGNVKSRLARNLDESQVVEIYKCFVDDLLSKINQADLNPKVYFHPPDAKQMMRDWLGDRFSYFAQTGGDLGQRMANAFAETFGAGMNRAVLIGCDFPDLPENIIEDALAGLDTHDAVIGPAEDGGYYLIGFRKDSFIPGVFNNICWGSETVYSQTVAAFEKSNVNIMTLPKWRDIDTYADLLDFLQKNKYDSSAAPATLSYLKKIGLAQQGGSHADH